MATVVVKLEGVDDIIKKFKAVPKQIQKAGNRAVTKTLSQIEVKGRREIARAHDISVTSLRPRKTGRYRGRVKKTKYKRGAGGQVWFGRNAIKAGYVGKARQLRKGAAVRGHKYAGSFVTKFRSGHKGIFRRESTRSLPIEEEVVQLEKAEGIIKKTAQSSNTVFKTVFDRELNFEVNVRGRN